MAHVVNRDSGGKGKIVFPWHSRRVRMLAALGAILALSGTAIAQTPFQFPPLRGYHPHCRPFMVNTPDGPMRQWYCRAADRRWYPQNTPVQQANSPPPPYWSQQPSQGQRGGDYNSNGTSSYGRGYAAAPPRQSPAAPSQQQLADLRNDIASPLHSWIGSSPDQIIGGQTFFQASGVDIAKFRQVIQKVLKGKVVFTPVRQNSAVTLEFGPDGHRKRMNFYLLPFCAARETTCRQPFKEIDGAIEVENTDGLAPKIYLYLYDGNEFPPAAYCLLVNGRLDCTSPGGEFSGKMYLTDGNTEGINDSIRDGYASSQGGIIGTFLQSATRDMFFGGGTSGSSGSWTAQDRAKAACGGGDSGGCAVTGGAHY